MTSEMDWDDQNPASGRSGGFHWAGIRPAALILITSLFALSCGPLYPAEIYDGSRRGPAMETVQGAILGDLERVLGDEAASSMTLSWMRQPTESRVFAGWVQEIEGIPVRGGVGRSMALKDPSTGLWSVHYRAFRYASPEKVPLPVLDSSAALEIASVGHTKRLWSIPRLELAPGKDGDPTLCWVIDGTSTIPGHHSSIRIDVDACIGLVVAVEEQICEIDIPGTLDTFRTAGTGPQNASTTVSFPLGGAQVSGAGASTYSALDGSFLLANVPDSNFTVLAGLQAEWGLVSSAIAPDAVDSAAADPAGVSLVINDPPTIEGTAQANAFHYMDQGIRFFVDSPGGFPAMVTPVTATTSLAGSCNAYYDPALTMLRFLQAGGGCVDSAYSSVVLHEFGHHVVASLGLAQQAFGEGYGDSLSVVILGEGIIGRDFTGPGTSVRDIKNAGVTIPCSGGIHFCGQALAGFWFDLRESMISQYGQSEGIAMTWELFVDWSSLTLGGSNAQPFHFNMLTEMLTVDDNDGDLGNGTPNFDVICAAALRHGVESPELTTLLLTLETGPGEVIPPSPATTVRVLVEEILASPLPNGAYVIFRFEGGPWQSFFLIETSPGIYEGNFPPLDCLDSFEWFVSFQDDAGITTTLPPDAISLPYSTVVVTEITTTMQETFAQDPGWSIAAPDDTATAGRWEWGDPYASVAQPSAGVPGPQGDLTCYMTGLGGIGQSQGAHDVDGGDTTLTSTSYPISDSGLHKVSYWRWFSNATSITTPDDSLFVYKSLDGGTSWQLIEEIGRGHPEALGGWYENSFWISEGASPAGSVMLRFHTGDEGVGNVVEAGVDLLTVEHLICSGTPPPPVVENDFIRGDCNVDGNRDLSDAVQMLDVLFGSGAAFACEDACDVDDGGQVNLGDVIGYLNELFLGGPGNPSVCGVDTTSDTIGCDQGLICP